MIRPTREDDKEGVVELIRLFHEEELYKHGFKFNYDKACRDFDVAFKLPCIISYVIDTNGRIDGFIGGILDTRFFLDGISGQELMWYVRKDVRKEGLALLKKFELSCKEYGCHDVMMLGIEGTKAERVYELMGYKKLESTYIKILGG